MAGNLHSLGAIPTIESARTLGYDVRYVETHDRHRRYQAFDTDGTVLGETGDENYDGFQTEFQALHFLAADTGFLAAVSAAGGISEFLNESAPFAVDDDGNGRINVNFTYGEELARP